MISEARRTRQKCAEADCPLRLSGPTHAPSAVGTGRQYLAPLLCSQEEAYILRELGYWVTGQWCQRASVDPAFATQLVEMMGLAFQARGIVTLFYAPYFLTL